MPSSSDESFHPVQLYDERASPSLDIILPQVPLTVARSEGSSSSPARSGSL